MNVLGYTESGAIRVIFEGEDGESFVPDDVANRHRQMIAEWESEGNTIPAYEPPALTIDDFRQAIEMHTDQVAQERQYSGAVSISTYVTSTNPAWAAEAHAFVVWRDAVWVYAFTELAKVQSEERAAPENTEAFLAELPAMQWPEDT